MQLTVVTPGSVKHPEITTQEDLNGYIAKVDQVQADVTAAQETLKVRVPTGRTINGHALVADIVLTPADVNVYDKAEIDAKLKNIEAAGYIPVNINGHLLDKDVNLTAGDIGTYTASQIDAKLGGKVDATRTVNGHPLSANVVLTAANIGSYSTSEVDNLLRGYVPTTRTVNGKPLSQNVVLLPSDFDMYSRQETNTELDKRVAKSQTVNGKPLTGDITLTANDVGAYSKAEAVPRAFTINGVPMEGDGMVISASAMGGYSRDETDHLLSLKFNLANPYGIGNRVTPISYGPMSNSVTGGGFFGYEEKTTTNPGESPVTTNMDDRPAGSTIGDLIAMPGNRGDVQEADVKTSLGFAFPRDQSKIYYRRIDSTTGLPTSWVEMYSSENPQDAYTRKQVDDILKKYIVTNAQGLIEADVKLKNNVAIRSELTAGGAPAEILKVTSAGAVQVGAVAPLQLFASDNPTVNIGGSTYKLYTEKNPQPLPDVFLRKDRNFGDVPDKVLALKNIDGAKAYSGYIGIGSPDDWTTAQFIDWLKAQGAFNHPYWMCRGSWSYSSNPTISDTGCGRIHLAGAVIEVMGTQNAMTIRITLPTTTSSNGDSCAMFVYINNGPSYSPSWYRIPTDRSPGTFRGDLRAPKLLSINGDKSLTIYSNGTEPESFSLYSFGRMSGSPAQPTGASVFEVRTGSTWLTYFQKNPDGQILQVTNGQVEAWNFAATGSPKGAGGFSDQLNSFAPYYVTNFSWTPTDNGYYVPLTKGRSSRTDNASASAVSFGYLLNKGQNLAKGVIDARGTDGSEAWIFNPVDGNISGTKKGNFASESWVTSQGYTTQSWVQSQAYATETWVNGRGYATQSWVDAKGYAATSWVTSQGYATQSWVNGLGLATETWVNGRGYATTSWVGSQGFATESWVNTQIANNAGGVRDIRLGTQGYKDGSATGNIMAPAGHVQTGFNGDVGGNGVTFRVYYRPIQKQIGSTWYTIGQL